VPGSPPGAETFTGQGRSYDRPVTEIHIERETRAYPDRLRAYRVILDDREVGRLRRGESLTVAAEPGTHKLHLAIDWCAVHSRNSSLRTARL
jgi:hypothetical protein